MTTSILQSFLDNHFIKTDDPSHIGNLNKAAIDVQKQLTKNKKKVIDYTLVALDPTVSEENSVILEVEAIIIKKWPTFRNSVLKTNDKPIPYIQAVILQALSSISKDINLAGIIWYTGCNVLSYYKLTGQEIVLTNFLREIGDIVESTARIHWGILERIEVDAFTVGAVNLPPVKTVQIAQDKLITHFKAGAVHSGWSNHAGGGENPNTQGQNNFNWPKFFSERTGKGLAEEINRALSSQGQSLNGVSVNIQRTLDEYLAELQPYLENLSSTILEGSQSLNKRSDLIWWKQALYSQALDKSYRQLSSVQAALTMAIDLAESIYPIYPKSVDYILQEALRDVLGDEVDTEISFNKLGELLEALDDDLLPLPLPFISDCSRTSLGSCIAKIINGSTTPDEYVESTNIDNDAQITLSKLTVWLFHDLQALKLATAKAVK